MKNEKNYFNSLKLLQHYKFHKNSVIDKILKYDYLTTFKIYNLSSENTKVLRILRFLSFLGSAPFFIILMSIFYFYGDLFYDIYLKNFGLMMFSGGVFLNLIFLTIPKYFLKRKRPYNDELFEKIFKLKIKNRDPEFGRGRTQSFPSGHAFFWGFLVLIVPYYFGLIYLPILIILLIIIDFSRIYFGCHFVSDVLIGTVFGLISSFIVISLFDSVFKPTIYLFYYIMKGYVFRN